MAYIGKEPTIGNYQKCDAISVVNGQAAYTLQVASTNVVPETNNHVLCSLNGILQSPGTSFTVSGSTLTFASNLATGDVIDFVMILGNVLDLGVPSDSTVSLAKLTATGTKDATTFLRGDNTFAAAGGGKVLQVVQTVKTDTFSTSSPAETAFVDVTGFSVTITPSATSSKILILWNMMIGSGADNVTYMKLKRGTTDILLGDASSTRIRMSQGQGGSYNSHPWKMDCASGQYEDSPNTTSATTYKWVWASNGSTSSYLNRSGRDHTSLNDEDGRTVSTITAMEIAG